MTLDTSCHTLRSSVSATGIGLFTARWARITLHPAPPSSGILFRRVDLPGAPTVPARIEHAVNTERRTTLELGGARVETTEHVLSALFGMGIGNAIIDLDADEVPMFDGSALPFVEMIERAGVERHREHRRMFQVREAFAVEHGGASIRVNPGGEGGLEVSYAFSGGADWPSPCDQRVHATLTAEHYARAIAPARTFSSLAEAEAAHAAGLFRHVTPRDMLVIGPDGPVDNTFRFSDEPARHKLLDLVGDLALSGVALVGRLDAQRSGHALNRALALEVSRRAAQEA